jgi:hypothetical protein
MKPQQLLPIYATGVAAKNSLAYMVDYGRCQWENFLGNFENSFCEYDPSILEEINVAKPQYEKTLHAVATPFVPHGEAPDEDPLEQSKEKEKNVADSLVRETLEAEESKTKSEKLLAQDLWPIATTCASSHNGTEEYCIYSNPSFNGGRGITILTTPSEAFAIAKSPAFTNLDLWEGVKDFNAPASDKWHVEEVPKKGMGLVASRNLQMGDHIMSVSAAIMTDFNIWDHVSLDQVRRMQTEGISHLPKHHQKIFLNLSTHDAAESHEEQVYKIILTNAFDISDIEILDRAEGDQGVNFFTVFPEGEHSSQYRYIAFPVTPRLIFTIT